MRKLYSLLIFWLLTTPLFASKKCAEAFASAPYENPIQKEVIAQEKALSDLIESYRQKLGLFQNPFALVFNNEKADMLFQDLSIRTINGKEVESPLGAINATLKKAYTGPQSYNKELIDWLVKEVTDSLNNLSTSQKDLQSNLLSLNYGMEYLRRYQSLSEEPSTLEKNGKLINEKPGLEDPAKKKNKKQEPPPVFSPQYPDLPKQAGTSTKSLEDKAKNEESQKKVCIAKVNFATPLFGQRYYSEIVRGSAVPFREGQSPNLLPSPAKYRLTSRLMTVSTLGRSQVDLFIPPGFKPLQPSDPRAAISRSTSGSYVLTTKSLLPEVLVPLVEDDQILMLPYEREILTRPVGFLQKELPDKLQAAILRKVSLNEAKKDPLKVARLVAVHLATEYLYRMGSQESDPIAALKAGAFRCDNAAFLMVGILRDFFQIPCRMVWGFRAKKHKKEKENNSYLIIPEEAHAWVEVFFNGKWHAFDPTPLKKDKKDDEETEEPEESEYLDRALEDLVLPEPPSETKESDCSTCTDEKKSEINHQERLNNSTNLRIEESKKENETKNKNEKQGKETTLTHDELASRLELGSLELKPNLDNNVLLARATRFLLQILLDPTKKGSDIQNHLNQISYVVGRHFPFLGSVLQKAMSAHQVEHPGIKQWVEQLARTLSTQELYKSYQEIHAMKQALQAYSEVLDLSGKIRSPSELLETLSGVQKIIESLAHPDAHDISLVQFLVNNLTLVTRELLKSDFNLSRIGPNSPTREVAKLLKEGKLNDLKLLSILTPLSDFILNSSPTPEKTQIKTWQRDPLKMRRVDILPAQRFSELPRAILGQPEKSPEQNFIEGTAYVLTRRQRTQIPAGYSKKESERNTILLYDTSGSMTGEPGRFQAGLISAFVSKALSDVSPSGRHRHRLLIVPFDSSPGTPVSVTNTFEALEVIRNYKDKLKNTSGGTNIQKALLQAMSLIADAEKRVGEPLGSANIILMTDGQADINAQELLQARNAIDRRTPLQTMFIAINETNEELMRFAINSKAMGSERGFYREFTKDHIRDILKEADRPITRENDPKYFYTDKTAEKIPQEAHLLMAKAVRLARLFSDQIFNGSFFTSGSQHLKNLEKLKWQNINQIDRHLEKWLISIRKFVRHPLFADRRILQRLVDDLVVNFEQVTGVPLNEMSDYEQEQLRHLVRAAAGIMETDS